MTLNAAILSVVFGITVNTAPIKVAVIDTGSNSLHKLPLCETGHADFTKNKPVYYTSKELYEGGHYEFKDRNGHGTNISHLIHKFAGNANYCQVIIKYYDKNGSSFTNSIRAFNYLTKIKVDILNYSSSGKAGDNIEKKLVQKLLTNGTILVVSAGNDARELTSKNCKSYPACYYKDVIVVGNGFSNKKKASTSNYGEIVDVWVDGMHKEANGTSLSGTSQSTAIATGKLIKLLDNLKGKLNDR